jgi:ribonuclease P protein component
METLRQRSDFLRAARARRHSGPGFLLQARRREPDEPGGPRCIRIGYTCSRKIGNSVIRNRAKRRLRAIARAVLPALGQAGWDYVLVGRPQATVERDFAALQADLTQALQVIHRPRRPTPTDGSAGPA